CRPDRGADRDGDDRSRRKVVPFRPRNIAISDPGLSAGLCVSEDESLFLNAADIPLEFRPVAQLDGYRRVLTGSELRDAGLHFRGQRRFFLLFRLGKRGWGGKERKQQRTDEK